jgi:hypothetical protein
MAAINPPIVPNIIGERVRFSEMLTNVCGLITPPMRDAVMIDQGIGSIVELQSLTLKEIDQMVTAINKTDRRAADRFTISIICAKHLKACNVWCKWQRAMGVIPRPANFTVAARTAILARIHSEEIIDAAGETTPTAPPKLMHTGSVYWIPWWKQFSAYCSQIRGTLKIPISYVYREHDEVTPEIQQAEYVNDDEFRCAVVVLEGEYYEIDNNKLWDLLVPLINTGDAWSFVKRFENAKNGRGAIQELRRISEGLASKTTLKATAKANLRNLTYTGRSKNHTVDQFIAKLQEGFTQLDTAEDPLSENAKVLLLLEKIDGVGDMGSIFSHICGDETLLNSFSACITYLQSCVSIRKSAVSSNTRNVSAATSSSEYGDLKSTYSAAEWKTLSVETKKRVIQRNRDNGNGKPKAKPTQQATSMKTMKRKVKALTKQIDKIKGGNDSDDADASSTITSSKKSSSKK